MRHHSSRPGAAWDWSALRAACAREARRLVLDPHDAEEVAQEALLRAWRQRHTCRTPGNPLPWVLQIARMEALRLVERRRLRAGREHADGHPPEEAVGEAPADEPLLRLEARGALRQLERSDRALVHARYMGDLSGAETAGLVGVPESTVNVRLHRARRRLRELLAPP